MSGGEWSGARGGGPSGGSGGMRGGGDGEGAGGCGGESCGGHGEAAAAFASTVPGALGVLGTRPSIGSLAGPAVLGPFATSVAPAAGNPLPMMRVTTTTAVTAQQAAQGVLEGVDRPRRG